jgi:cardiolipin synthase
MNLDFLSMQWLEEGCLVVDDRAFAADFEQRWLQDLARSRPMTQRGALHEPRPDRAPAPAPSDMQYQSQQP